VALISPTVYVCSVCQNDKNNTAEKDVCKRKQRSSGRALGSRSEGRGFDPCPMLDGSGVKAMPGSIPIRNSGSL